MLARGGIVPLLHGVELSLGEVNDEKDTAWEMPNEIAGEVACQLEHRINDGVKDALELKAKLTSAMASGRPRVRGNGEQQAGEG